MMCCRNDIERIVRTHFLQVCDWQDIEYIAGCSQTPSGHDYLGHIAVTESGRECQAWSAQSPHSHDSPNWGWTYSDGSAEAARNYCRNPDNEATLWCYTMDPSVRWEYCDVPICEGQSFKYYIVTCCHKQM